MKSNIKKYNKPVKPILKKMGLNDVESYHASQRGSVEASRNQLQRQYPDKKWVISTIDAFSFKIERIV